MSGILKDDELNESGSKLVKACKAKLGREDFDLRVDFLSIARKYFPALSVFLWKDVPPRIKGAIMRAYHEIAEDTRNNPYYSDIKEGEFTAPNSYPIKNSDDFKGVHFSRYGRFSNFGKELTA